VQIMAKRIAEVISSVHIKHDDKLIFLSVALGVSSMQQEDSKLDDVLSRATTLPPKGA